MRLGARWDDFWFRPDTPTALARCRIGICAGLFYVLMWKPDFLMFLEHSASFSDAFYLPFGLHKYFGEPAIETLRTLHIVFGVALFAAAIGFATRLALFVATGLLFYITIPGMYGKILNFEAIPILALGILTLAPSADGFSVDRLIKRRLAWWPFSRTDTDESGEYRWPVKFLQTFVCMVFFMAGLSKLITSGPGWVTSDNLQILLVATPANQGCLGSWPNYPELNAWIVQHPTLLHFLAAGVLLTELGAPIALIGGIPRAIAVAGFFGLNLGFRLFMGPQFDELIVTYTSVFIPWERVFGFIARKVRRR